MWLASLLEYWGVAHYDFFEAEGFSYLDHFAVRLQLHARAYNLGNFLRTVTLPATVCVACTRMLQQHKMIL